MKTHFVILLVITALASQSCKEKISKPSAGPEAPVVETHESTIDDCYIEDFSHVLNANQFEDLFDEQKVYNDTLWMNEGSEFVYVTKTIGCPSITAYWKNRDFSDLVKVSAVDRIVLDNNTDDYFHCDDLKSRAGVEMRMTLRELVELNEDEIEFAGFGWDQSGIITSFGKGNLSNSDLTLYLDFKDSRENNFKYPDGSEGDQLFNSGEDKINPDALVVVKMESKYSSIK